MMTKNYDESVEKNDNHNWPYPPDLVAKDQTNLNCYLTYKTSMTKN